MGYLLILIIIALIAFIIDLKKENKYLRNELLKYRNNQYQPMQQAIQPIQQPIIKQEQPKPVVKKKEYNDKEIKNTGILVVGAIFIIMSAIVFLMSTWGIINNVLKTSVLVLLVLVFLGASKLAKEKFNLKKASTTFFYIGMAYIPISLLSISILGLFGNYLSISGEGRYIFLTISAFITALIYYVMNKKTKDNNLFFGSILVQVLTVILFSCIFETNLGLITLNLLIYNILFIMLTKKNKLINDINQIYYLIPFVSIFIIFANLYQTNIFIPISSLLVAINLYFIDLKKDLKITGFFFTMALNLIGIYFIKNNSALLTYEETIALKCANSIVIFISLFLLNGITKKKIFHLGTMIYTFLLANSLYIDLMFMNDGFIKSWMLALYAFIMLVLSFDKFSVNINKIINKLIPIYLIITGLSLLAVNDEPYHFYIIFSLLTFIIGQGLIKKEHKLLNKDFFNISHIFIFITYIICYGDHCTEMANIVIYYILLLAVYVYSYFKTNNNLFKFMAYITTHLTLYSVVTFLKLSYEVECILPMAVVLLITYLENKNKKLESNFSKPFISLYKIIAYCALVNLDSVIGIILTIGFTAFNIYENRNNNKSNIIPLLGLMTISLHFSVDEDVLSIIMLMVTIATTLLSFEKKKINTYTIFSFIYLMITFNMLYIQYVEELLFSIWAFSNYYMLTNIKSKDVFKFLTGFGLMSLYNAAVYDLDLDVYTAFEMLGYIALAIYTIRVILPKYFNKVDVIECVTFGLLYLIAFNEYRSEMDGMVFMFLLCGIVMLSYIKKYGTLFCITLITMVLNLFLLTRYFWLAIPWWIYLLLIGSLLISFAIKNEADDKGLFKSIKSLKDKIDK